MADGEQLTLRALALLRTFADSEPARSMRLR